MRNFVPLQDRKACTDRRLRMQWYLMGTLSPNRRHCLRWSSVQSRRTIPLCALVVMVHGVLTATLERTAIIPFFSLPVVAAIVHTVICTQVICKHCIITLCKQSSSRRLLPNLALLHGMSSYQHTDFYQTLDNYIVRADGRLYTDHRQTLRYYTMHVHTYLHRSLSNILILYCLCTHSCPHSCSRKKWHDRLSKRGSPS